MNKPNPWLVPVLVLCIIVLASLYLKERDKATTFKVREGTAKTTALQCSSGTQELETQAARREQEAGPERQAAADKNRSHQVAAQSILAKPAAVPGNSCASAEAVVDDWWKRRQPKAQ